jgi:hypothetical protein
LAALHVLLSSPLLAHLPARHNVWLENAKPRVLIVSAGTKVSTNANALADTYHRNGDSPVNAEVQELCTACGGTGSIADLSDYPASENRHFCSYCEMGRRMINRIIEITTQTRIEERSGRKGYRR